MTIMECQPILTILSQTNTRHMTLPLVVFLLEDRNIMTGMLKGDSGQQSR